MFNWFKDKFKKKDDKENKEELIEENLSEEVESKEEADEENILTNEEIREEEAQEIEEIDEKLEEVSEGGSLSEEDVNTSEKIQDTNEAFKDKSVIEDAQEKKEAAREETQEEEIEEIHEKLEEVSEEGSLSDEEVETSEKIEDTNDAFKDKKVIEDALEQKEKAQDETKKVEEVVEVEIIEEKKEEPKKVSLFQRLKEGLDKTRKEVGIKINTVLGAYVKIDDEMLEDLEDILISADIGMETTMKLIDNLRETIIREKINDPQEVKPLLMAEAKKLMNPELNTPIKTEPPVIILVVGVNGVGKTTTIGKLSSRFKREGKSVLVCAADTFRAAAIDQLKEWGNRAHVDIISHAEGSDPAAVVFDAIEAAKARKTDVLIVDTAGRLHNKSNLMKELEKINRIISNKFPEANRENLLVLDSTTGQNAINQAKTFREATDITGIALTKLDGTAKGGVVVALQSELGIPIKLIGVGEGIDDLQDFNIDNFLETIFG
ncbi:MAG: signal recognition particle-docking protein FtsY [Peptoniphilus harei]|uniref:Signal recognition particle receptor FtsY n=1 Tax=Peptoniphilus harei ACS-146-V-Sch2b TaxID=908338 RepID=E4KZ50_9FIRM|nr:signal recognition particle-docking protein FtsY [Peptoniphilus harei]EFR32887.1 signal recognition particle-docking protein FtsY [Peptoniphilus harei ACS-146-V-Sch2b]MDK7755321.1 signal recognition particle-docking protein FtsY [Peptoniphilus harei]MDK7761555.1 signal recognition particle-docking protein FtsY [Peptoniphilus harei]MDK8271081.1 signal recognition particle-docking protein FtsY [Peptoniphilus harei]MDK8339331.1 signal recognition particle-docking protein FtsY [Peptoniphilus ha